ncbi:hypothetical protein SPBR_02021 [Sporothrix brasiliensis 5110]|uniref:PEBP-like protein n=1 Tax=Sporothrix brasiliensis 5110 TaxID=1398154 RepID=A0A0C2IW36_9PEZI|nr:uncharacterized protein SPBR_02021 [Sporothrix brasiliensis 5110]KIH91005.1 hypothetical protein SPBR_02021 [Sporothrix brasiliensis 5110]
MKASILAVCAAAVGLVSAQTPDGFTPSVATHLDVTFGSKAVSPSGTSLAKEETAKLPTIGFAGANATETYLFVMIDLDVPSGTTRNTLLHAMIQDFKVGSGGATTLTSAATSPASYMGPAPPKENPAHPHHYVEVLFVQPAGFAVPASQASVVKSRIGFKLADFATAAHLGEPVAANYFMVTG